MYKSNSICVIAQRVTCPLELKKYICDEDEMKMVISLEAKEVHKGNDDNENDDLYIMTTRGMSFLSVCMSAHGAKTWSPSVRLSVPTCDWKTMSKKHSA